MGFIGDAGPLRGLRRVNAISNQISEVSTINEEISDKTYEVGSKVEAYWKGEEDEGWYPAKIDAQNSEGSYHVTFEDSWGSCTIENDHIRPMSITVGTAVQAFWNDGS